MEKVIPKSKTKFLQNFFLFLFLFFSFSFFFNIYSVDESDLQRDEVAIIKVFVKNIYYLLTNWFAYLYWRIQSPRPDVMPDRREGITRAAGFVFACIDTQTS